MKPDQTEGDTLTFGDWMSGGVDMSPKRSSCSTGWMSERSTKCVFNPVMNPTETFNVKLERAAEVLLGQL